MKTFLLLVMLAAAALAQTPPVMQRVKNGSFPDDPTAERVYTGFQKVNNNFDAITNSYKIYREGQNVSFSTNTDGTVNIRAQTIGSTTNTYVLTNGAIRVNGTVVLNPNLTNTASVTWATNASGHITATAVGGGGVTNFVQLTITNAPTGDSNVVRLIELHNTFVSNQTAIANAYVSNYNRTTVASNYFGSAKIDVTNGTGTGTRLGEAELTNSTAWNWLRVGSTDSSTPARLRLMKTGGSTNIWWEFTRLNDNNLYLTNSSGGGIQFATGDGPATSIGGYYFEGFTLSNIILSGSVALNLTNSTATDGFVAYAFDGKVKWSNPPSGGGGGSWAGTAIEPTQLQTNGGVLAITNGASVSNMTHYISTTNRGALVLNFGGAVTYAPMLYGGIGASSDQAMLRLGRADNGTNASAWVWASGYDGTSYQTVLHRDSVFAFGTDTSPNRGEYGARLSQPSVGTLYLMTNAVVLSNIHTGGHIEATNGFISVTNALTTSDIASILVTGVPGSNGVWFGLLSNTAMAVLRSNATITYRDLMVDNTGGSGGGNVSATNNGTVGQIAVNAGTDKMISFTNIITNVTLITDQVFSRISYQTNFSAGAGTSGINASNASVFMFTNTGNFHLQITNFAIGDDTNYARWIQVKFTNGASMTTGSVSNRVGNTLFPIAFNGYALGAKPPYSDTNINEMWIGGSGHYLSGYLTTNIPGNLR
jgi:hypothetical protein